MSSVTVSTPAGRDDVDIDDPSFLHQPFATCERLQRECPIAWSSKHGGFWLLTRHQDVRAAALDWRSFTSSVPGVTAIPVITPRTQPQLPIEIDPPQHSRYRALIGPAFAQERVRDITPRIKALALAILEGMAARGGGEAVSELCVPIAVNALAAFTDVPLADSEQWIGWITRMFDVSDRQSGAAASRELIGFIDALIAERRSKPADDFISTLLASEIEGERLDDAQVRSFMTVVFGAGFETTADALSVMLHWLAENPAGLDRLRSDPDLAPTAVEEFLRFASPIQIFGRNATRDLVLHDRAIAKGDIVALGFGPANRDREVFDRPEEVLLDRKPNRHLAFGAGPHLCAGAGVARMELAVALEALAETGARLSLHSDQEPAWKSRGDRRGLVRLPLAITRTTS